jgi:ABC-2 type transport system ATP-binding protein
MELSPPASDRDEATLREPEVREPLVSVIGLSKRFSGVSALEQLNLTLSAGEVVGLLGPNGAGKTTTLKVLLGLLKPSEGHARILGLDCMHDAHTVKEQVGFMPDEPQFYEYLSGRETLDFVIGVRGLEPQTTWEFLDQLVETLDIAGHLPALTSTYSLGTKKKLALLCALVHRPRVLLLDEPTNGLDPPTAQRVRQLLRREAEQGAAVLLSTHLLDMAERMCDRMVVVHRGRMVAEGTAQQVRVHAGVSPEATLEDAFLRLVGA